MARALLSPQTWLTAGAYFGLLSAIYSFGLFLPTIIFGLGYTANEAQLWSVIPYAVAACTTREYLPFPPTILPFSSSRH